MSKRATLIVDGTVKDLEAAGKIAYTDGSIINENLAFRTAIYGDENGVVEDASVKDAFVGGTVEDKTLSGATVKAEDVNFNAVTLNGGKWNVSDIDVSLSGGAGNDFVGLGTGIFATGNTELTVDNATIHCDGVAHAAVIAKEDAQILVKNSELTAKDGALPVDYVGTVFPEKMKSVPWMLGLNGTARATNLMDRAKATYYNSYIGAEKWGALSTDDNKGVTLWAINSEAVIEGGAKSIDEIRKNIADGKFEYYDAEIKRDVKFPESEWQSNLRPSGYGTYSIGGTKVILAGTTMVSPDYVAIVANGPASLQLTSSEPSSIADAYGYLDIAGEVEPKRTIAVSQRFGVMYHSGMGTGVTNIEKGSVLACGETPLLIKGCGTVINVDASEIYAGNGVILQVMDNDDAGINVENFETTTDYEEKHITGTATESKTNASCVAKEGAVFANFSNMTLNGDIYNASGWELAKAADALEDYNNDVGGGASAATDLSVALSNVVYTGLISTSEANHPQPVISHNEYYLIGEVTNKVQIPENAGIIVRLTNGSVWNVTGTGYVTSLTVDASSELNIDELYVNGVKTELEKGVTYTGVVKLVGSCEKSAPVYVDATAIASGRN